MGMSFRQSDDRVKCHHETLRDKGSGKKQLKQWSVHNAEDQNDLLEGGTLNQT